MAGANVGTRRRVIGGRRPTPHRALASYHVVVDAGKELNTLENALRDLVYRTANSADEDALLVAAEVPDERIQEFRARREREPRHRPGGEVEQRLLYYSDFKDLIELIQRNWKSIFVKVFTDKSTFDVFAGRLLSLRNPDAHSRALLPFEEHLVIGMSGQLRQQIALFLSAGGGGPEPEHFARIEDVKDQFGLRLAGGATGIGSAKSSVTLRPGDTVSFIGSAWDPRNQELEWQIVVGHRQETVLGADLNWTWEVRETDISEKASVLFTVRSTERSYTRMAQGDDWAFFHYKVLPHVG